VNDPAEARTGTEPQGLTPPAPSAKPPREIPSSPGGAAVIQYSRFQNYDLRKPYDLRKERLESGQVRCDS
jgi:hypothetical protein